MLSATSFATRGSQVQILPLRPAFPTTQQRLVVFVSLPSTVRATVMATDCAPLSADYPEMENGSHRSPPLSCGSAERGQEEGQGGLMLFHQFAETGGSRMPSTATIASTRNASAVSANKLARSARNAGPMV